MTHPYCRRRRSPHRNPSPARRRSRSRPGRRRPRPLWGDRGSSATETAVVLPAAYLLILLIVQISVWAHSGHVARTTAEATLAAARAENSTAADAHTHGSALLDQLAGNALLQQPAITVERGPTRATVVVHGRAPAVIPGLSLPVTVRLSGPVERFTPPN